MGEIDKVAGEAHLCGGRIEHGVHVSITNGSSTRGTAEANLDFKAAMVEI